MFLNDLLLIYATEGVLSQGDLIELFFIKFTS